MILGKIWKNKKLLMMIPQPKQARKDHHHHHTLSSITFYDSIPFPSPPEWRSSQGMNGLTCRRRRMAE
jgi:hypothetical protein